MCWAGVGHTVTANNGKFLGDLQSEASNDEIRKRWKRGDYGDIRHDYAKAWWKLAGRGTR